MRINIKYKFKSYYITLVLITNNYSYSLEGGEDVKLIVEDTTYGPVLSELAEYTTTPPTKIALRWPVLEANDTSYLFSPPII